MKRRTTLSAGDSSLKRTPLKRTRPKPRPSLVDFPSWYDEGKSLQSAGLSYQQIGDRLGVSRSQAYYWLTRKGRSRATRICPTCSEEFRSYDLRQKFCSRKCFAAREIPAEQRERQAVAMRTRKGRKNPNFKHGNRVGAHIRGGLRRFQSGQHECQHPGCLGQVVVLNQHHVVYEQHVQNAGGDRWHPDNALALCVSCHMSHHQRGRPLPLSALRDENYAFAYELMGPAAYDYLRRYYDGDDERLDALLVERAA